MIDMIKTILDSNLRPIEKLFLTIECILREKKPYDLYDANLTELKRKAETLIRKRVRADVRRVALDEATKIFQIREAEKLLAILTALSYYSYVTGEFVHDHETKRELLVKVAELGFRRSEIRRLNAKWTKVAGSSEELFNKVLERPSVQGNQA